MFYKIEIMKAIISILIVFLFIACSAARVTDSWFNETYKDYQTKKKSYCWFNG